MALSLRSPALQTNLFRPGMRVAVACSGGADSTALLRILCLQKTTFGVALSVAHMNHGIRGAESDQDQAFVESLASGLDLPFHLGRVDTPAIANASREGLEEVARHLRYAWFWELLQAGQADAIVTAHTLNDQAETVLHRLLRGAWTEGLGGIHPVLNPPAKQPGVILRPFLSATRPQIEEWLREIGQPWCEDSSNRDLAFTRNRLRHQLLPALSSYNPAIGNQLAQLATLARDEEAYWQAELARMLPSLLLPGKAVRGGGRATSTVPGDHSLSIEIERLRALQPAVRRRVLRAAAAQFGSAIDFADTQRLLDLCGLGESILDGASRSGLKLQMERGLRAERTPRELRLFGTNSEASAAPDAPEYMLPVPGAIEAPAFGLRLEATVGAPLAGPLPEARLRAGRPADRVTLRHARSPMKIKDALKRLGLPSVVTHAVLEWQGEIVWMRGVQIESEAARAVVLSIAATPLA